MILQTQRILVISVFFYTSYAIQCVSKGVKGKEKTCTGDVCANVFYMSLDLRIKECLTGFNYTGCTTIDDITTFCYCHTDNCNSRTINETELYPSGEYNCSTFSRYSSDEFQEDYKTITVASVCGVEGIESFGDSGYHSSLIAEGLPTWKAYTIEMDKERPNLDLRNYYYIGGVYAFSGQRDDLHYRYKCRGEMCNDNFDFSWVPKKKDVTCFKTVFDDEDAPSCQAEFCVYAQFTDDPTYNISFCMHMNQTNAEGEFKIGMYKFRNAVNYICKTDNCNINKTTAMKSIKEYPFILTTPTPLLSTGIPLDSPQHSPVNNFDGGYCRIHLPYILFTIVSVLLFFFE